MSDVDLKPYKIEYGYVDSDGVSHLCSAEAESALHAADILHRLRPAVFEVKVEDINGRVKDVTANVHHMLVLYVEPAYRDGREFGPYSVVEAKANGKRRRD